VSLEAVTLAARRCGARLNVVSTCEELSWPHDHSELAFAASTPRADGRRQRARQRINPAS
jgi:hypothetical protein